MRTNTSCTVYNKYVTAGNALYQRTVISAVEWENRKAVNVIKSGLLEADSAVIFIPSSNVTTYLKPKAWQALSTKTGKWTLQNGDVIVKGTVTDEIHAAVVSPPSAAFTMTDLKAKYDDVITVHSVDTFDLGSTALQHWKVSGS
jgi:hypothetical protein